jgi:hypothetical protein
MPKVATGMDPCRKILRDRVPGVALMWVDGDTGGDVASRDEGPKRGLSSERFPVGSRLNECWESLLL